jgi:hypothetical protein
MYCGTWYHTHTHTCDVSVWPRVDSQLWYIIRYSQFYTGHLPIWPEVTAEWWLGLTLTWKDRNKASCCSDLRLPSRYKWDLRSSGNLGSVDLELWTFRDNPFTSVKQSIFLGCLTLEDRTDRFSQNIGNSTYTLRNIPEERISRAAAMFSTIYIWIFVLKALSRGWNGRSKQLNTHRHVLTRFYSVEALIRLILHFYSVAPADWHKLPFQTNAF